MLRFLHGLNGSFIVKFLLVLIGISFIGWGFGEGVQQGFSGYVAKVNGQKIPAQVFQRELDLKVSQLRRSMGDNYSEDVLASMNIPQNLLRDKIRDILLLQFAAENNIHVANAELAERINSMDAFKGPLGEFDKNQYKMALQNAGYTVPQFEAGLRTELLVNRISDLFTTARFTNEAEIQRTAEMFSQSRNIRILRVVEADVPAPAKPTDDELNDIYQDMLSNFITPERRTVEVLVFDTAKITPTISVTEADIEEFYHAHRDEFGEPEGRDVRHILVKDEDTANKVLAELKAGKTFAELAKKYSKDTVTANKGGELGTIYHGDMLAQFDEVAFKIKKNKISEPVKTPFGYHVLEVTNIKLPREQTIAEAKKDIKARLLTERALDQMYDAIDNADADLASGASLQEVQQSYGGELKTYASLDPQGADVNGKYPDMINAAAILDKAFTIDENIPSTVVNLSETQKAFVNVSEVEAPRQRTFDEVRDELAEVYKRENIERAVLAKATQIMAQRKKGDSFETLVKRHKLTAPIQTIVGISRLEPSKNQMVSGAVQEQIAALKEGEVLPRVFPTKLGAAIYEVTKVEDGDIDTKLKDQVKLTLSSVMANDLFAQFQEALQNNANIKINEDQLAAAEKTVIRE